MTVSAPANRIQKPAFQVREQGLQVQAKESQWAAIGTVSATPEHDPHPDTEKGLYIMFIAMHNLLENRARPLP